MHVCWLSSLTPVTYLCKLLGIRCVAAFLQLELFRAQFEITGKYVTQSTSQFTYTRHISGGRKPAV
ncbi:hypothetical protein DMB41_00515 [Pectobacterium carotovorum subsp. carotovorum]|nr:hypothetical protein DMB41_00515 [Pectobacterium carotovorum subsp. carotovorum]